MKRILVLGTGTNVGKTHVSRALARSLRTADPGTPIACLKPIESGFNAASSDATQLEAASSGLPLPQPHPLHALAAAVSPHLATRLAGLSPLNVEDVRHWILDWETRIPAAPAASSWCVIETAGALFSPLAPGVTNFDLARALEPALWVLVAADNLGVLHDATTTLALCRQLRREPDFVVLSAARPPDESTGTNARELALLGIAEPIDVVGRDVATADALARAIIERSRA